MANYIIKISSVATEANEKYPGQKLTFYRGKGGQLLNYKNDFPSWILKSPSYDSLVYSSLAGAKKALRSAQEICEWETEQGWWESTAELVEVSR